MHTNNTTLIKAEHFMESILAKDKQHISKDEIVYGIYYGHTEKRKKHAQDVDNAESADITNNPFVWLDDPSRSDFPLIDTIIRQKPKGYTKSRGKSAYDELVEFYNV